MKTKFFTFAILAAIALSTTSCSNDNTGDTTPPVIKLIAPTENGLLEIGDEHGVHFDMQLTDNVGLANYKVEIHNNFDGHTHSRAEESQKTVDFTFNKVWKLEGQKNTSIHHHEIVIPKNATPGKYHMMVYCTDLAGNETHVARNIVLTLDEVAHEHTHEHEHND